VDVPALNPASGASGGVDGKVESVQDGKATVKLSGGAQVQVPVDREIPVGTAVTVAAASDGTLQLTVRVPDAELAKVREAIWQSLRSLVGESLASELSVPLAKGDFAAAARSLPSAGRGTATPVDLAKSVAGTSVGSGPIFLSEGSTPPPARGDAVLAILSRVDRNVYAAEFAGQSQVLFGPSDVEPSLLILARARPLPGGGAVWTPAPVSASVDRGLPDRIQAGSDGARELFQWAGVQDASPEDEADLGRALADAARFLLDDAHPRSTENVSSPLAVPSAGNGETSLAGPHATGDLPAPSGASVPIAEPADRSPPRPSEVPPGTSATDLSKENATPTRTPDSRPDPPGSVADATTAGRTTKPSFAQIPSDLAVRVLAAWSLDLPATSAVLKATLGQVSQDPPAALASLEKLVQQNPGRHPALEAALQGLRETGRLPAATLSEGPRRALESAVLEALAQESPDHEEAEPPRKAAQTLLADRLPDRTVGTDSGQTYWAERTGEWEKARIVVRDDRQRREKGKGGSETPPDFHAVDIGMDPKGLGRVDARLELRGRILTTRLDASDQATADLLRRRLPELSAAFEKLGLGSGGLEVRRKAPVKEVAARRRPAGGSLDVRA